MGCRVDLGADHQVDDLGDGHDTQYASEGPFHDLVCLIRAMPLYDRARLPPPSETVRQRQSRRETPGCELSGLAALWRLAAALVSAYAHELLAPGW